MGRGRIVAAIDVGSNAVRLGIARTRPGGTLQILDRRRLPVRLGTDVFSRGRVGRREADRLASAFGAMRERLDRRGVRRVRAVATSALREARNRTAIVERLRRRTGIRLEVIDGREEARLICVAATAALRGRLRPRIVVDLGGGSLQVSVLRRGAATIGVSLPLGAVRLLGAPGRGKGRENLPWRRGRAETIRRTVRETLAKHLPRGLRGPAALCGGGGEILARLAPPGGARRRSATRGKVLDIRALEKLLPSLLSVGVKERMERFDLKRDRADVLPAAALVLLTLARYLRLREYRVPGVGLREGVLREMADGAA